jgi:ATP/maltotriose-dependent transcriptional regulator MalT
MVETQQAAALAREFGDRTLLSRALVEQAMLETFIAPETVPATLEQAIEAGRQAEDGWLLGSALSSLAFYWIFDRDQFVRARPLLDELDGLSPSPYWQVWHALCVGIAHGRQGRLAEARAALEAALAGSYELGDPHLESWSVVFTAQVLINQGDYEATRSVLTRSIRWQCRSAFTRQEFVQSRLALLALAQADLPEARRQLDAVGPVLRQCGIPFLMAWCDVLSARLALEDGNLAAARSFHEAASNIATTFDSPWALVEAHDLGGRLARADGDASAAEDLHHHALAIAVEYGFGGVAAETIESLAALAAIGESHNEAARLFGAAQALREAAGQVRWPLDQPSYDADITALRAHLGDEGLARAWNEGLALSLDGAAAYASRARGERKRPSTGWDSLTPTELEVVALAAQGLTNAEIGRRLFIAAGTAKVHLSHVYGKLGVANRAELAAEATARGIGRGSASMGRPRPRPLKG